MKTDQRDRAWRRAKNHVNKGRDCHHPSTLWKKPKRWKHMYVRSEKIGRARQLGFAYPVVSRSQQLQLACEQYWNFTF